MNPKRTYDIIIIGAGPAGAAAAYYTGKQGWDVCWLDRATFPREKVCGCGLTPRTLNLLEDYRCLRKWPALETHHHGCSQKAQ